MSESPNQLVKYLFDYIARGLAGNANEPKTGADSLPRDSPSTVSRTTKLPDDPVDIPESRQYQGFSENIWDYLIGDYHKDLPYMPSRQDRDLLDERRLQVWNYFFRIQPNDIGKPQHREIASLRKTEERITALSSEVKKLEQCLNCDQIPHEIQEKILSRERQQAYESQKQAFTQEILHNEQHLADLQARHDNELEEIDNRIRALQIGTNPSKQSKKPWNAFRKGTDDAPRDQEAARLNIEKQRSIDDYTSRMNKKAEEIEQLRKQLGQLDETHSADLREKLKESIVSYNMKITKLTDGDLENKLADIAHQIEDLKKNIGLLKKAIPPVPSSDDINLCFIKDMEELRRKINRNASIGTKLAKIMAYDLETADEQPVDNPIIFVSPGELQEPELIPATYIPPALDISEKLYELSKSDNSLLSGFANYVASNQLARRLQPKPVPDRAKHLLAKQKGLTSQGYKVFFGLYYVKALILAEDMVTIHSFFYDFINGKSLSEKTVEFYFDDVVEIEQSKESRIVALSYDDTESTVEIENAPTISLILSNGDRHTVTFATPDYLLRAAEVVESERVSSTNDINRDNKQAIDGAILKANAALNVLRRYLRAHKGVIR